MTENEKFKPTEPKRPLAGESRIGVAIRNFLEANGYEKTSQSYSRMRRRLLRTIRK